MATINRFEDLDIWQLAFAQTQDFDILVETTPLSKDFVMGCIAEGFERSGNNEFKNLLVIAKGSNGEFRSQLYRCLNRKYITQQKFDELYSRNEVLGKKLMSFISYLQKTEFKGQRYKIHDQLQTSNIKPETL